MRSSSGECSPSSTSIGFWHDQLEHDEERRQHPRDLLGVRQCDTARRQLAEHDVEVRHEEHREHGAHPDAQPDLERQRQRVEPFGEDLRQRLLGEGAQTERGERDPQLTRREHAAHVGDAAQGDAREPVAIACHGFEPCLARADQRKLNCDEKAVQRKENDDRDDSAEHGD
jgi:hypothetical protein